jgi:hypothetical protein
VASLKIPESHRLGLAKLRQLSDQNIEVIVSALQHLPPQVPKKKDIIAAIAPTVPSLPANDLERVSETLFSLYCVRADADVSVTKFASDVSDALRDSGEQFTGEEFARFKNRIERLLSVDQLSIASKALALQADHENVFCEAKVLTDVRPVFGTKVDDPPEGFVVTHTLKIGYHDGGSDHRDYYVALDEDDLVTLRSLIERAEKKANSLISLMSKTGVRNFTIKLGEKRS